MSFGVFLMVLLAAFLHAGWNALIKLGTSKLTSMLIMTMTQGAMGAALATTRALPEGQVWWWLIGSGVLHASYKLFLTFAYEHGDLSRVYPIARGAAPLMVLGVGAVFLRDEIAVLAFAGVVALGVGILLMARGVFAVGESGRLVPLALCSAVATAGYSLVDGLGARVSGDAVAFVAWLFVFDAMLFLPMSIMLRGTSVLRANRHSWAMGALAAALSYSAYAIAVWAMTVAPIALVAALRETSILFAIIIGWTLFGERMDRGKAVAAGLIVAGVVLMRL